MIGVLVHAKEKPWLTKGLAKSVKKKYMSYKCFLNTLTLPMKRHTSLQKKKKNQTGKLKPNVKATWKVLDDHPYLRQILMKFPIQLN